MKTFFTFSLSLLMVFGFINLNGQTQLNDLKSIKAFKQQLLTEATFNNAAPVGSNNMLKQNYERGTADYGNPPDFNWIGQFGGSGFDNVNAVISDSLGNIYITGSFSGEMSLSGTSYTTTGDREAIVAKFDNQGNLIWLTQIPATEYHETFSKAMCMDTDGNLYITGYYTGSVTIGESVLPDMNNKTLFYAKLNNQGELLNGTYHNSGENPEIGFSIGIDNNNNVYLVAAISTSLNSRHTSYLLKYDDSFNLISENYFIVGFNNLIISGNNIYYSGVIQHGDDGYLDENVTLPPTSSYNDVFVAKSNLAGVFEWGYTASHTGNGFQGDSQSDCLVKDNNGNFFLAGSFRRSLIFGNDTITNLGTPQGFLTKFDSQGNFAWLIQYGNNLYSTVISSDLAGNAYTAGNYSLLKFDTGGNMIWDKDVENQPNALSVNKNDKIISSGSTQRGLIYITQFDNNATKEWTKEFDGNSAESWLIGMVSDTIGNVYTYNYTSNTIDFLGVTVNRGIFICRQNGNGNVDWITQFPDIMVYSGYGNYIAIDPENKNIYITGTFNQDMIIPGETTLTPGENGSTFIIKYDVNGNYKWAKQEDFTGNGLCLTADYDDNVLLSGTFGADTITIGDTELVNAGLSNCFIAKYDINGNPVWAKRAGGEGVEYSGLVSTDANNNIYFTGEFTSENVLFDNTEYPMPEGSGNIIFVKMTPDGNIQFIKSLAASQNTDEYWDWYCWPTGIKTDINGNTYIKGAFGKGAYFDDIYLENQLSHYNKFIVKTDSNGNAIWAKPITPRQNCPYNYDYNQFDIDKKGNVYFGMQAKDTLDFENDYQYIPSSGNDEIITKYSNNGNLVWVKAMQGNETDRNWLSSIAVYDTTNVFAGGWFRNFLSIDGNDMLSTNRHGFVAMFGDDIIIGIKEVYNSTKINVYPNPAKDKITVSTDSPLSNAKIEIYTVSGKLIKTSMLDKNRIDINELSPGSYIIKVYNNKEIMTGKFIKL